MEFDDPQNTIVIQLATGRVVIELFEDVAPLHAERLLTLARSGAYDNVAFHRVIEGFVAQTGDVEFGDLEDGYDPENAGRGSSGLGNVPAEFSDIAFERGIVGMARAGDPLARFGAPERQEFLDSADSQFFIMFEEASFLNGNYTAVGRVIEGMELVDQIKRGAPGSGAVTDPDRMVDVEVAADLLGFNQGLTVEEAQEVALLYEAGLDRDGDFDLDGLNFWIDSREAGASVQTLAGRFLASDEFTESFGDVDDLSDRELVEQLYRNVLEREGEAGGVDFWTGVLASPDFDRDDLLVAFARSPENVAGSPVVETLEEIAAGEWAFV